jgi:hypothetical protein
MIRHFINVRGAGITELAQRLGYRLEDSGFESRQKQEIFHFTQNPILLRRPPSVLFNCYRGGDRGREFVQKARFTKHVYVMERLRISGVVRPLPLYTVMGHVGSILPLHSHT